MERKRNRSLSPSRWQLDSLWEQEARFLQSDRPFLLWMSKRLFMGRGKCTFLFYFYDIFVYYWLSEQSEDPIGNLGDLACLYFYSSINFESLIRSELNLVDQQIVLEKLFRKYISQIGQWVFKIRGCKRR